MIPAARFVCAWTFARLDKSRIMEDGM
jgi:hypothetical protein